MRIDKARETVRYLSKYELHGTKKKNLFANINICFNYIYPPDGAPQHIL